MSQLALEGQVQDDTFAGLRRRITELEAAIAELEVELAGTDKELEEARRQCARTETAARELRRILTPLHRALGAVFGTFESIPDDGAQQSSTDPRWERWKRDLPGKPADMIDLLRLHGSLSTKALMTAMKCGKDAVYQAAFKLGKAGLLASNSPYSLKQL